MSSGTVTVRIGSPESKQESLSFNHLRIGQYFTTSPLQVGSNPQLRVKISGYNYATVGEYPTIYSKEDLPDSQKRVWAVHVDITVTPKLIPA